MVVTNVMIHLDDAASNRKNKFIIFSFFVLCTILKNISLVGLSFGLLIVGKVARKPLRNSGLYTTAKL